jgi:phosphoribosylanthranilate isomerase
VTGVKICGVTSRSDLATVAEAGADAVGFVVDVSVDTPREVSLDRAARLAATAPPFLTTTAVTMADSVEEATTVARAVGADVLQLHSSLDADGFAAVRSSTGLRTVAAVGSDEAGHDRARELAEAGAVDAVLVDSANEEGGGGTGETHDWTRTRALVDELGGEFGLPTVLAGGLTPENVAEAVRTVRPYAVDVASGVEVTGGRKDEAAVEAFVANAGRAPSDPGPTPVPIPDDPDGAPVGPGDDDGDCDGEADGGDGAP